MENTEILSKPPLQIKAVVVQGEIPVRNQGCAIEEVKVPTPVTFIVDTETWECQGQVLSNDPVMADEEWWAHQCQRVSDRVRAQIKSTDA